MKNNMTSFRVFGPDETASNRLQAIYEVSKKTWMADMLPEDADGGELSRDGRVMEMLSEHTLLGWLEGYLLTGRHGFFHTYEAFAHVIDSMFNQHAKWLDISKNHVPWRAPVASENILLSSTVWRQDHNGFSHQDPGFIDLVTNKSAIGDAHLSAAGRQHAARRSRITACAAPTASTSSSPTSRSTCSSRRSTRRSSTAQRASASGRARAPTPARSPMSCWLLRRRRHHGGAGRRRDPARAGAGSEAALRQRRGSVQAAAGVRASARVDRARVRQPVHHGQADHLQFPRLPVADPQARRTASRATTTCTCAATRRKATSTRRSSWRC